MFPTGPNINSPCPPQLLFYLTPHSTFLLELYSNTLCDIQDLKIFETSQVYEVKNRFRIISTNVGWICIIVWRIFWQGTGFNSSLANCSLKPNGFLPKNRWQHVLCVVWASSNLQVLSSVMFGHHGDEVMSYRMFLNFHLLQCFLLYTIWSRIHYLHYEEFVFYGQCQCTSLIKKKFI